MAKRRENETKLQRNRRFINTIKSRIKNLKRYYGITPALSKLEKDIKEGRLSLSVTKNMTESALDKQFARLESFYYAGTSTVKGMEKFLESENGVLVSNVMNIAQGDPRILDMFFELYNDLVEDYGILEKYKYETFDIIDTLFGVEYSKGGKIDLEDLKERIMEVYNKTYEAKEKGYVVDPQAIY